MYPDIKSDPRVVPGLAHLFYRPEPKKKRPAGARYSLDRVEHRVEDMPRGEFTSADVAKLLCLSIESARLICTDAVNAGLLQIVRRERQLKIYKKVSA
ncbi:hypothetical protein HA052_11150 [Chromobacterium haemolyticum]|uniref:Helix-turn-helix domain-containing protein n=1 Tax=Chromobacterium fluminis TaxID=3044269 RepID=A0ABX0L846_9NEIS|nr:hypothetical protein [Chromobacterium haemolyticum]NHR05757.1 hypothetical protein [Chromobacterium haemolyticum]